MAAGLGLTAVLLSGDGAVVFLMGIGDTLTVLIPRRGMRGVVLPCIIMGMRGYT